MTNQVVPGEGKHGTWMIVGERPGADEVRTLRPFTGKTGQVQDAHLVRNGLHRSGGYLTNLCKTYHGNNDPPTPAEIAEWSPILLEEIRRVKPRVILAAGHTATLFFLGPGAFLDAVHGVPHRWSDGNGFTATVVPSYHPAAPFYAPDLLQFVVYDYQRFAQTIRNKNIPEPPVDLYPNPKYYDLDDGCFDWYLMKECGEIAFDTEGVPGDEWSIQVCVEEGTGYTLRAGHRDFKRAMKELRRRIRRKKPVMDVHAALYDLEMAQGMDLDLVWDLSDVPLFDTMMAAYLHCLEPQSLKMLARRHCGMVMNEYLETVGQVGLEKQLAYLEKVLDNKWPDPEPRVEHENDGTSRLYKPQPVSRRAEAILLDVYTGKVDNEGRPVDPLKRWRKVDRVLRRMVERRYGRMPIGTLADVPLRDAVYYSSRDPDATLRVARKLRRSLAEHGLSDLMQMKMDMLRVPASIKILGLLGRRAKFEGLSESMTDQMDLIVGRISRKYMGGRPFNPASGDQVATLMRRQGLVGAKKTKTGKMSTAKKSIDHLRHENEAIEWVEQWRERQKVRDSFADPVLENWPDEPAPELMRVKCDLKITRVTSGRFSAAILDDKVSAPLLAIPVRSKLAEEVRDCYEAEEGYLLGSFDLDQAEMRIMADEAHDSRMIKIFNEGKIDIHTDNAAKLFGVAYDEIAASKELKKKYRTPAKRAGFGVITGIQGAGLYDQLRMEGAGDGWDPKKCDKLISEYLNKLYPSIKAYMLACRQECRNQGGMIKDRWGMPRYLPAILNECRSKFDEGYYDMLEAERQTHSHKIQGGAQGWLQHAMSYLWVALRPYGDSVRFILQVHDELIFEVAEGMEDEVKSVIIEGMSHHGGCKLLVPMKASGSFAKTWGKLKD